ncbi:MAG: hypothetical protein O7C98_10505, partial [Planctomycetota bacterium]|nr:hypothetical protein [Planctomycetota bacterium]
MRLWIPLLILIGVVHAQAPSELTLPALKERIRNADTGTADRLAAIESALGRFPSAPRELREEFLKDGVAERIVEPVVEAFLDAEPLQYQDALGAICELTLSDNKSVADTVMRRISTATKRDPGGAQLRDLLIQWGRGEFKELNSATTREGVARALSAVHHRKALEALIDMWDQDADPKVRAEAGQRVQARLPFSDAAAARRFLNLEKNRSKTFIALMLEQMEKQRTAFDVMRAERNEFLRKYLERESPQTAFVVLEEGDADKRRIAADRIHAFAKDWKLTNSAAKQFAKRATTAWVRESERQQLESSVLAPLTSTLTLLADQQHEEVLWQVAGFKDALDDKVRPLLMLDGVEQTVANLLQAYAPRYSGALQLLEQMAKYRDGAKDDDTRRRAAIVALGNLTSNDSLDVGPNLARVLAAERNPDLQSRLLNGLRGVANPKPAYEAAARILKEGTLKEGALRDCIKILSKIDTSEALQTLIDVAKSPPQGPGGVPNRRLQLDAIRDGLLARQYGADEQGQQSAFACL